MSKSLQEEQEKQGWLQLGFEMAVSKRPKEDMSSDARRVVLPDRVPVWKGIQLDMSNAERPFQYTSEIIKPEQEVCLVGEGLNQLYVCFGAPGTGKSYLMKQLLKQLANERWKPPWGGLLLDPKQTLIGEVDEEIPSAPLYIISRDPSKTRPSSHINLLKSSLGPRDLGVALALAAESAGVSSKEPYWLNEMKRIFGAGLALLDVLGDPLTLRTLAELLLGTTLSKDTNELRTNLEIAIKKRVTEHMKDERDVDKARHLERAVSELSQFTATHGDNAETVRSFIGQVLSPFLDPDFDYVSDTSQQASIADLIFAQGKWVALKVPKSSLSVSRMLSALAKVLFQRAALDRKTLFQNHEDRRIFLFVDEYAELASDLPGDGFGDSIFFSQARQFNVLSFIATQGVPLLENSGVREAWKTILSNSAGKLFFRVADPDTAELASKLLGEGNLIVTDASIVHSPEGGNVQKGMKLERRTVLTSDLFATGLQRGQFAFIGITDGTAASRATVRYVEGRKNS